MSAPQCDHREPKVGRPFFGRRCTKRACYHASNISSEGGGNFCQQHGEQRAKPGVKLVRLESLGRCYCTGGDVPHEGLAEHTTRDRFLHLRRHKRCTRSATVQLRRVVTTEGKRNTNPSGYAYCQPCAEAIERYQGSEVERL